MGHQRLGTIPTSQKWTEVVEKVARGGPEGTATHHVPEIAKRTLEAAEAGLQRAVDDEGLRFTFYLLTQLVLAAREDDWRQRLDDLGIHLTDDSSLFDFTAQVQRVIDDHLDARGGPTDISEMGQQAAGEALALQAGPQATTLFGSGEAELKDAVRGLSTKVGFARLGQRFFGCFIARFLNFYLSRITPAKVEDPTAFNEGLQTHCHETARIVQQFCGDWYSKTEFQQGISLENTAGFLAVVVQKLQAELQQQRERS
jgi:hypothetical protein